MLGTQQHWTFIKISSLCSTKERKSCRVGRVSKYENLDFWLNHILRSKKWHTSVTSEAYILRHWDDLRHPHDPTKDKCFGTWIDGSHLKGHFRLTDTKTQCHCHSNRWWWHLWDGCQRLFWSVSIVDFSQILVLRRILNSCPTEWHADVSWPKHCYFAC